MKKYFAFVTLGLLLLSMTATGVAVTTSEPVAKEPVLIAEKIVGDGYYQDMMYPEAAREIVPLFVDPGYSYLTIKPGDSEEVSVVLYNHGEETITVEPYLVPQFYSENELDEDWVTISPAKAELEMGEKQEFTIKVSVPEDAELGYYSANVFFSGLEGDIASLYPGYNGVLELSVNVWLPPNVEIFNSYISDRVEAGAEYEYSIKLKNVGDRAISIGPEFEEIDDEWYRYGSQVSLDEKDVTITAPSVINPGEKAVVKVKVSIPADAEGSINGRINLNIADRTINEWSQKVSMNFDVWQQPEEPFTTTFTSRTDDPITIRISSMDYNYGSSTSSKKPSFDIVLKNENGEVRSVLVNTGYSGSVSLGQQYPVPYMMAMGEAASSYMEVESVMSEDMEQPDVYQQGSTGYTETYRFNGAVGEWTLEIMPHNTENFEYSINIGPAK
ncbi:COG1470 family protein [Methanococcoides methylutens]|uniref:COG1470 family protein n=1 Tax=Methanococcoides methylutens TaxID=2226 RepID=UPI004043A567